MKGTFVKMMAMLMASVLLCGLLPTSYAQSVPTVINDANVLVNGDLEWGELTDWVPNGKKVEIIPAAAKDGQYGVRVTSGDGEWDEYQGIYGDFAVEPNTDYVFSFDHKSDSAACVIVYVKNLGESCNIVQSWPVQVPGCWSKQEYHFNSGSADTIRIQLCVGAKNSVRLFDNLRLYRPVRNTFGNGMGSVSELENGRTGLAFRFDVAASVQSTEAGDFLCGTVDPYGDGDCFEILRMGALVTNRTIATEDLTLEAVDGRTCIDISAAKVLAATAEKAAFAVRVTNVPRWAQDVTVTARPYLIYKNGEQECLLYGSAAYSETCNSITERNASAVFDAGDEWELIWNDEFGGTAVDETKWYGELMVGEGSYYATNREENLSVQDGNMLLTVLDEPIGDARFTGSRVNTGYNFSFLYGRLEFRAKLPWGKGVAAALWTLGDYYLYNGVGNGWPYGGEIDIMELVGDSNTDPFSKENMTTSHNIHWGYDRSNHYEVGSYKLNGYNNYYKFPDGISPSGEYHIYAVEWDYRQFKFFVDDVLQMEIRWGTNSAGRDYLAWFDENGKKLGETYRLPAFDDDGNYKYTDVSCADLDFAFANEDNPHFLIMNHLMCGWNADQATNGGNLPQSMYVDYVRVYQKVKD